MTCTTTTTEWPRRAASQLSRIVSLLALFVIATCVAVSVSEAQRNERQGTGPLARLVVIQPKPGQDAAFEEGYRRHLTWHRDHRDPWSWYGWSFVLGERLGLFMDGTFAHSAAELDNAVDPAGDGADNARNVVPHADFVRHAVYQRISGAIDALPDTSAYLVMTTYWVRPGEERKFEAAIAEASAAAQRAGTSSSQIWFRLVIGGESPEYLLFRPVNDWAEAAALPDFVTGHPAAATSVARVRSELLRYRRDMSYHP